MDLRKTKLPITYHDLLTLYRGLEQLILEAEDPDDAMDIQQLMRKVQDAYRAEPDNN